MNFIMRLEWPRHACLAVVGSAAAFGLQAPASAEVQREANLFGLRPAVSSVHLSPDGNNVVFIAAGKGPQSIVIVAPVAGGELTRVAYTNADPWRVSWCDWASNERLVCSLFSIQDHTGRDLGYSRTVAFDIDGGDMIELSTRGHHALQQILQSDGWVIGWNTGEPGHVLMARNYVPEDSSGGRRAVSRARGLGVDLVNAETGEDKRIEYPDDDALSYLADDNGEVRIKGEAVFDRKGRLTGEFHYFYRLRGDDAWHPFSTVFSGEREDESGMDPLAIDSANNAVYALKDTGGREALYRVALDGSLKSELLLAHDKVDVGGLETLGSRGRVIGVGWIADSYEMLYFDKELEQLAKRLSLSIGPGSDVSFVSANADESKLLLFVTSDVEPGRYFVLDRATGTLNELMKKRPNLANVQLGSVKPVRYKSADRTEVPAYLTLPPGSDGKGLPAIVMPHGGPSARDALSFDWWAQYYASRGFAVLQPNYRGSSGYGDDWFVNNGFQSWDVAMADINAGAKWMVAEGIADPGKMAIVGWSYGGYAALQANVVEPDLYKAIIAVAPVTDLAMLVSDERRFTSSRTVREFVGTGPHVAAGSPRRHAGKIDAPVLMFSGTKDLNVDIRHAREMEEELKQAGKTVKLVEYEGLDHSLVDSNARIDMLERSDAFLRKHLGI